MLTRQELKEAHDLTKEIEVAERLLAVYRQAERVCVGLPVDPHQPGAVPALQRYRDELVLTAAELGDQIVSVLERRIAPMRESLRQLGVE